jgi:hypothetical protein
MSISFKTCEFDRVREEINQNLKIIVSANLPIISDFVNGHCSKQCSDQHG